MRVIPHEGMAWTLDEIAQVRAALIALATGTRAVTISFAGPPARTVTYGIASIKELRDLLDVMEANTEGIEPLPTFRRATFSKGFYPPRGNGE